MASLFNTRISDTYSGLIKTIDNAALTASLKELTDGTGLASGIFMNTAGDFKVTAILEFGSLKDTGENITISKFVDAADGISNNDNDTTIPTTAAIIDYVAAQITIEDLDFTGDTGSGQIDLDSQIFAIGGTTNEITTVASGQSITFSLDSTGVNLPNNSNAITQTAGDNSTKIATTSYVDTLDAASDLDFSGDSGTGDVNLNTQTFAVTGTANQIESSASGQGLSLQFPSAGVTLPNGSVATTQSSSDDSTKVATTAYVKGLNNASDLDFITDSGSGAVVLNSETLSVVGTTNEIETSGSGQEIQIGLPSSISTNLVGNVTGNVQGDVTGDLTGNADTATKWQTARDLSLTGQATGTISSVDGTNNVSGAVTLDNNSVTGKVLTGLTSPSASSVLATDTIVEGFGKLQSQVNGLAGGLRFIGSWDADTNSPVLSDGGGEAANGTTTSTSANKLVDSSASFTSTVTVGDKVVNQVDGQTALVSNVDSDTTLSLDADIMLSGEAYTIDNSPFITQGHYYVVSVGGTTSLNGVSNWTVGDWVIAGANNQWTKLDHSQVDGTGTTGNLTKWSSTSVIADSIVSESGSAITVDGSLTTNTNLSSTGNFAVNTNKFTVASSSGNTAFTGDLAINTNKFTVNATSGNTLVAGTLDVTGKSTFGDDITISDSTPILDFEDTDNTNSNWRMEAKGSFGGFFFQSFDNNFQTGSTVLFAKTSNGYIGLGGNTNPQAQLDITGGLITSGDATFTGDVNVTGNTITVDPASGDATLLLQTSTQTLSVDQNSIRTTTNNNLAFLTNNTLALTLDTSQNATFAGKILVGTGTTAAASLNAFTTIVSPNLFSALRVIENSGASSYWDIGATGGASTLLNFYHNANTTPKITFTHTGGATFAGDVGIGVTPSAKLDVLAPFSAATKGAYIEQGEFNQIGLHVKNTNAASSTTGILQVDNSAGTAFIVNGSGNVGIGTDSPDTLLNLEGVKNTSIITLGSTTNNSSWSTGDKYGAINFYSADASGAGAGVKASISYETTSSSGATNHLSFRTAGTAAGTNNTERMRIDSSGNVGIGGTPNMRLGLSNSTASTPVYQQFTNGTTGTTASDGTVMGIDSDGDFLINNQEAKEIKLYTSDTLRLTINSSGNATFAGDVNTGRLFVDSGTANEVAKFQSTDGTAYLSIMDNTTTYSLQGIGSIGNNLTFYSNNAERMRINSSGNVGINYSATGSVVDIVNSKFTVATQPPYNLATSKVEPTTATFFSDKMTNNSYNSILQLVSVRTSLVSGQNSNGYLGFSTLDNSNAQGVIDAGRIAIVNENGSARNSPTALSFWTNTPNGNVDNTPATEKMRITSGGVVGIGDDNPTLANRLEIKAPSGNSGNVVDISTGSDANTNVGAIVFRDASRNYCGQIVVNGSSNTTQYLSASDYRLKEDLQDFAGLDMVSKIPVYKYKLKKSGVSDFGVMAHELQEVLPKAVNGEKDGKEMQGVDYSKIVPLLVKSIQELKAEVDKLKQECKCKN